ncbi:MAG: hypothetical protein HY042_09420, partial [Spirochaetia bacterium]|nr:hypothetical protein [Spirochaetia bacterium]
MSRQTLVLMEENGSAPLSQEWSDWRWQMQNRISSAKELFHWVPGLQGRVNAAALDQSARESDFQFAVTPYYARLADAGDPRCPILRQILPDPQEESDTVFTEPDPLSEERYMP